MMQASRHEEARNDRRRQSCNRSIAFSEKRARARVAHGERAETDGSCRSPSRRVPTSRGELKIDVETAETAKELYERANS